MPRRIAFLTVVSLTVSACSGGDATSTTTTATTTTATTTTSTTTSTTTTIAVTATTTSTTTTTLATTTTTRPPLPVVGWDGPGLGLIVLTVDADRSVGEFTQVLQVGLDAMGLIRGTTGTDVEVVVRATPLGATYNNVGICYTGARVDLTMRIIDATGAVVATATEAAEEPTSLVVLNCRSDPADAPFRYPFESALGAVAVELFAEGAVPLLASIMGADHAAFPARIDAIQAVRLMDWDRIALDAQFAFLDRALWFASQITHMSDDGDARRYRTAVQRLFEEALDWQLDLPQSDNASLDALAIRVEMSNLALRYRR